MSSNECYNDLPHFNKFITLPNPASLPINILEKQLPRTTAPVVLPLPPIDNTALATAISALYIVITTLRSPYPLLRDLQFSIPSLLLLLLISLPVRDQQYITLLLLHLIKCGMVLCLLSPLLLSLYASEKTKENGTHRHLKASSKLMERIF